ncbi:hypothetical protein BDV95DRAFT_639865 [Massariosphaeria phaeospora]|uniref:Uncharacterized protein n=1 Tax=Massariosphaeria phaeospora TaxID=100035 RepID=A0A7C8I7Y0_9PLEO|nr:hypothetical protein BDV95DRAFT_639865 [Massariosphaeria phaeospora]
MYAPVSAVTTYTIARGGSTPTACSSAQLGQVVLGRAYTLLSTPTRPPRTLSRAQDFPFAAQPMELRLQIYGYFSATLAQRHRYWAVMTDIFIKALGGGRRLPPRWRRRPDEVGRYTTGIVLLACGHALGSGYHLWDEEHRADPEHTWTFADLRAALMATAALPRNNTDFFAKERRWYEYLRKGGTPHISDTERQAWQHVSQPTLEVLDLAREHLRSGDERDWTTPEIVARLLDGLLEGAGEEERGVWVSEGVVPWELESWIVAEADELVAARDAQGGGI